VGLQAKLLRVLQERVITRLGSNDPVELDVRFIATSKAEPEAEVAAGRFRSDLYYRLNAAMIRVPPLSARREDIPHLFLQLVRESAARHRVEDKKPLPGLLTRLSAQEWPGNVRELRNAAERFVLGLEHDGEADAAREETRLALKVADYERSVIAATIAAHGGKLRAVYETLGISRKTLYEKMQKHGLDRRLILESESDGD
jgi:two-component system, NtrC family, C4-dicarboxylate transport response regulator DctD